MERLLYNADRHVRINAVYNESLEDFLLDCASLGFESPIDPEQHFLYTPQDGLEFICPKGCHAPADSKIHMEFQAFINKAEAMLNAAAKRKVIPARQLTNIEKRQMPLEQGGYGSMPEQLEMLYDKGYDVWKQHIAEVKQRFPKED